MNNICMLLVHICVWYVNECAHMCVWVCYCVCVCMWRCFWVCMWVCECMGVRDWACEDVCEWICEWVQMWTCMIVHECVMCQWVSESVDELYESLSECVSTVLKGSGVPKLMCATFVHVVAKNPSNRCIPQILKKKVSFDSKINYHEWRKHLISQETSWNW